MKLYGAVNDAQAMASREDGATCSFNDRQP
jgi:hypothetical protein